MHSLSRSGQETAAAQLNSMLDGRSPGVSSSHPNSLRCSSDFGLAKRPSSLPLRPCGSPRSAANSHRVGGDLWPLIGRRTARCLVWAVGARATVYLAQDLRGSTGERLSTDGLSGGEPKCTAVENQEGVGSTRAQAATEVERVELTGRRRAGSAPGIVDRVEGEWKSWERESERSVPRRVR